jgi:hypothetical protein
MHGGQAQLGQHDRQPRRLDLTGAHDGDAEAMRAS